MSRRGNGVAIDIDNSHAGTDHELAYEEADIGAGQEAEEETAQLKQEASRKGLPGPISPCKTASDGRENRHHQQLSAHGQSDCNAMGNRQEILIELGAYDCDEGILHGIRQEGTKDQGAQGDQLGTVQIPSSTDQRFFPV